MSTTLTPVEAARFRFSSSATMSEKYDGVRAEWNGKTLTTRTGNPIHAPDWFIRQLPRWKLTGELWMGRGTFTECQSTVLRHVPDSRWRRVRLMVFEGEAAGANVETVRRIPVTDGGHVRQFATEIIRQGGEGAVVVEGGAIIKIKPCQDAEAVIIGYRSGGGRFQGHTGAILARDGAVLFGISSGLTDSLRRNPPPIGATITYTFSGSYPSGKPRFPAFLRVREAA